MFFAQSATGAVIGFYQVLSIFVFPVLLKWSHPVGLFSNLNLAFGAGLLIYMHIVRLSHPGKVCSGDFLDEATYSALRADRSQFYYLIIRGRLFYYYLMTFWIIGFSVIATIACVVIVAIRSFR